MQPRQKRYVGNQLMHLRKEHQLSREALAIRLQLIGCNIDRSAISRIEANKRFVTERELKALVRVLRVNYVDIISEE